MVDSEQNYHLASRSETPAARSARQRRKDNPEAYKREVATQAARKKLRMATDPAYKAAHAARNNKRLKTRRCAAATWPRWILNSVRARAKKEGIPFNLEVTDLALPSRCPVFKTPWVFGATNHPHSPSLDRFYPERGYVKGNVSIISRRANAVKNDATWQEIQAVADWVRQW